ncbi:GntR family transcriptional regulator [Bacillus sp. AFS031507]|uniref:GntR family transcriptional regulator n=1 Tax=Bacillus sp. AFS031507 TaxID=2033496 RepID=UPI000BFBC715|nr:GntR family transcriptional regulator [Bacillus sp. AFS031507]PGY09085.1 GntR family transcriptional regulator [Bacillus sp. AFS031507]
MKNEPLYQQIKNKIKEQILSGRLRVGDRVPSEKELTEEFHVSQITTKNALSGLAEEGIVERIKGKGTFVCESNLTTSIRQPNKPTELIGLILPSMKTRIELEFVNFIEKYVSKNGHNLIIKITRESQFEEADAIEMFKKMKVKGMIIFPTEKDNYNEAVLRLTLDKFPLVLIDRYMENILTYSVTSENEVGTLEAISFLLNKGHKNIGLVSPIITNTVTDERARGFENAFLKRRTTINKNLWLTLSFNEISQKKTPKLIKEFLMSRPEMTAVFTMNAELAVYTHLAISSLKNETCRDIELLTFDSPGIPGISFIKQDIAECSKKTVDLLLEQIGGIYKPKRIYVPVHLNLSENVDWLETIIT